MGDKKPRVVIAGAGVAGMSAAHVLADAGFDVTVFDKAKIPGGRCMSYFDEGLGHTVEHGIHGVFPRYKNLRALWSEANIKDDIFTHTKTTGVAAPGRSMMVTELAKAKGPAPFFLTAMVPPGVLRWRDYLFSVPMLMRTYAALDGNDRKLDTNTFAALLRSSGVSGRMASLLLIPYARNLAYARGDEVSARIATEALNYYLLENADDVKAQWVDGGMVPLIFEPWKRELERRGVKFVMGRPIQSIVFDDQKFIALATKATISDRELGEAPKLLMRQLGSRYLGLNWQPEKRSLRAFEGTCTHAGCRLNVEAAAPAPCFSCPCHGGRFDAEGNVLRAPPEKPLPPVAMHHDEQSGVWYAEEGGGGGGDGIERADYAVLALDIASLKAIFPRAMSLNPSTATIPLLRTTSVSVLRMRFRAREGKPKWSGPDTGVFAAEDFLDNFFALHTMQKEFAALPDLFLECHVGECEHFSALEDDDIYDRAAEVLDAYFPGEELGARLDRQRSRVLRHQDVFSLFAPGDHERTPTVSDPRRPNLMFAGDWILPDDKRNRSFFMERAAVTGIEAANAILRAAGMSEKQRPIERPTSPFTTRLMAWPVVALGTIADTLRRAFDVSYDAR